MKLNPNKLMWLNTASGVSAWNPAERKMATMNNPLTNVSTCRVETSKNLEQ